jgi:site-specific DNA-cytosine methylase
LERGSVPPRYYLTPRACAGILRRAGEGVTGTLQASGKAAGSATQQDAESGLLVAAVGGNRTSGPLDISTAVNAHGGPAGRLDFESETFIAHALRAEGFDASEDGSGRGTPLVPVVGHLNGTDVQDGRDLANPVTAGQAKQADTVVAFSGRERGDDGRGYDRPPQVFQEGVVGALDTVKTHMVAFHGSQDPCISGDITHPVGRNQGQETCIAGMGVRRLTPRECERLQGFPDDYTRVPNWDGWRDCEAGEELEGNRIHGCLYRQTKSGRWRVNDPDGPRYKALGNSMAVPVMRLIGARIQQVESLP